MPDNLTAEAVPPLGCAACPPPSDTGAKRDAVLPPLPPSVAMAPPVTNASFSAAGVEADADAEFEQAAFPPLQPFLLLLLLPVAPP